jgi:adenine phosphoribosyltransferase
MQENIEKIRSMIREIPNFPKEGILFRDITTALKDAETLRLTVDEIYEAFKDEKIDYIAGIESRGFIYGMPLAYKLGCGFIPVRKPNKLPAETIKESYDLEYGSDTIEIHADAIEEGANVLVVDDLLATGGTAKAACNLIRKAGGNLVGAAFLIELCDLGGAEKLSDCPKVVSMLKY